GGMLLAAHARTPSPADEAEAELIEEQLRASLPPAALLLWEPPRETEPAWTRRMFRKPLKEFLSSPLFITTVMASAFVGSTWYIRNWIVTGNPVYAFFNDFFHGRHVNPEVMESAAKEWAANGSGIGRLGDDLTTRLRNTWAFFVDWKNSYQLEPFFAGFACFGALLLIARALASPFTAVKRADALGAAPALKFTDHGARFGFLALLLALALFAFHYLLAPYYLYQIAMVMPALAALGIFIFPYMRLRPWRWLFAVMVLLIGLVPGISMALMGFKLLRPVPVGNGRAETQVDLFALRHPLPDSALYYRWQWGADAEMWEYINANLKGEKILTHENRHLMFDPTIELIHLDDWAMQLIWPLSPGNQIKDLKSLGIRYYLFVPNERNHPVNAKMRTEEWVKLGLAVPVFQAGENRLFRLP
ncbi:hypothetical protein HY256_09070, partial [Candidatus Sumerlaeota bacterium]|nr:hypothetical protein [Candidatus Sumerlaeota bacterium]